MLESKLFGRSFVPTEAVNTASKMSCPPATSVNPDRKGDFKKGLKCKMVGEN